MLDELRKRLAAEFMQRTADGTLAQAATRLLAPGEIHHDWRFAAGWDSFLKAVAEAHRMSPERRIEIKHLLSDGDFVLGACPRRPTTWGSRCRGLLSVEIRRRTHRRNVGRRTSCPSGFPQHTRRILAQTSNQSMKPTAPLRCNFRVFATTPCRGLSLYR